MTSQDVLDRLREITAMAGDDEVAHSAEDRLHQDVLKAIADGSAESPENLARLALETRKIDFARWYA